MKYLLLCLILIIASCTKKDSQKTTHPFLEKNPEIPMPKPFELNSKPYLIQGARIMTAAGQVFEKANLYMKDGIIQKISEEKITVDSTTEVIDGTGLTLTPGIIDVHSHMGVYPSPNVDAHEDGNEMTRPVTPDVWAEHAFWPQDPDLWRALAGGVTTIQVLPGSGNLVGGRSFTAKLIPKMSAREMRFPGAPQGLKMACGENPKRVYRNKSIMTRMGNVANYRKIYQEALEYMREIKAYEKNKKGQLPKRNFISETLVKVLEGKILVHFHCYRADDIGAILDLANEFGFKIRTVHHGLEAYKVAQRLAKEGTGVATWADWWGFKAEAFDGIPYNAALLEKAGAKAIIHSDSAVDVRFLNLEAGKALAAAKKLGLNISEDQALAWVTKNAAWALGVDHLVGTLEEGKQADLVVWKGHPFSIYTKAKLVFINGEVAFDRTNKKRIRSDFEVGYQDMAFNDGRDFFEQQPVQNMTWFEKPENQAKKTSTTFLIEKTKAFIDGKWRPDVDLLIKDGQVAAINPKNVSDQIEKISGRNKFVSPGLIDPNSLLGLFHIELDSKAQDIRNDPSIPSPELSAVDALNHKSIRIPIFRAQGVTTAISRLPGGVAASRGAAFDLITEKTQVQNKALFGQISKSYKPLIRSRIWSQLRTLIYETLIMQKAESSVLAGKTFPMENKVSSLTAMLPVLKGHTPYVMGANRTDDISRLLNFKKNRANKINFVIDGGAEAWLSAPLLKTTKTPVMLAPSQQTPTSFDKTMARFDQAALLNKAGIPIIIKDWSDAGAPRLRQEAGFAVKYGLHPDEAMKAITLTPSNVFGLNRGEIKKGAKANIVLWSADPLEPTSVAERVWIGGEEQDMVTRHQKLAEKYLN